MSSKSKKMWTIIGSLIMLLIGIGYFLFGVYDKSESLQDKYPMPIMIFGGVIVAGIACAIAEHKIKKLFSQTEG